MRWEGLGLLYRSRRTPQPPLPQAISLFKDRVLHYVEEKTQNRMIWAQRPLTVSQDHGQNPVVTSTRWPGDCALPFPP